MGMEMKTTYNVDYIRKNRTGNVLFYPEIQTTPGQSGSPIFAFYYPYPDNLDKSIMKVIGVHTAGDGRTNLGTLNEYFSPSDFDKY